MFRIRVILVILVTCCLTARAEELPRTISTNGDATIYVVPDEVVVNVGIETFDADLDKAKAASDGRGVSLLKAIRGLGVEERSIQIDRMTVSIDYRNNDRRREIEGYTVHRTYSVTLKDLKLFEKLTDAALKNGANQLLGFEFRTTELRKHRDAARMMAAKAAREKAEALANELNCRLGKPHMITEGYGGGYVFSNNAGNNLTMNGSAVVPGGGEGEGMPLGQISVRSQVSVTFDLVD